ncbi:hypothetical protein O181_022768 [Austropuccinia psidii MF-1]|uniref:Uncharacterized protein n=1 Tax=Austropuccinia psidii MF-1 TaxID=1389203 RepID=A0A9Q3GWN8_9BASI|nr:hypothetical protein [Austropuccinia psidii MF-1]
MSSKLTELTESSPSVLPPSVICGSGILSQLGFPWSMASSGHFYPSQTYDGSKEVEALDPAFNNFLMKVKECFQNFNPKYSKCHFCSVGTKPCCHPGILASNVKRYLWRKKVGPVRKEFPVSETPTPDGTAGYSNLTGSKHRKVARWTNVGGPIPIGGRPTYSSSEVPISRTNTEAVVEKFQSQVIPSTPRNFQPILSTIPSSIPPPSPSPSTVRPALVSKVRPSPIPQPRNFPMVTFQQLQPVASSSRRREDQSPLPFPASQVFQKRENWPICVTREDPNMASEGQDAMAKLFIRVDKNSRKVIMYADYRTIPGTASEKMAAKLCLYENELINGLQRTFNDLGRES